MGNCLKRFYSNQNNGQQYKDEDVKENAKQGEQGDNNEIDMQKPSKQQKQLKSWEIRRKNLNIENYRFKDQVGQELIKKPGSIDGQQFVIENCSNCRIYILDHTATVLIDDCTDCAIFVGPCNSSVFIRTSQRCKFIVCCGQFRTRDISHCDFQLYCQSQPTIESSHHLRFGCFYFTYKELAQQFKLAGLNIWNNNWSDFHDFTKNGGGGGGLDSWQKNYTLLPENENYSFTFIPVPSDFQLDVPQSRETLVVPVSKGVREIEYPERIVCLVKPQFEQEQLFQLVRQFNIQDQCFLIRSWMLRVNKELITMLPGQSDATLIGKQCLFLEIGGVNIIAVIQNWLDQILGININDFLIRWESKENVNIVSHLVFENFKDEHQ